MCWLLSKGGRRAEGMEALRLCIRIKQGTSLPTQTQCTTPSMHTEAPDPAYDTFTCQSPLGPPFPELQLSSRLAPTGTRPQEAFVNH